MHDVACDLLNFGISRVLKFIFIVFDELTVMLFCRKGGGGGGGGWAGHP